MSHHNRCLSCMTPLSGASACPACGAQSGSEPDNPLYLPAGCLLNNRYLIGRMIGVGGFGIVYLAWDNNLDIKVAIKEYLPKEYAARASDHLSLTPYTGNARDEYTYGMERFLEEAKALAKFQDHVGIVTVYESFKANNTAYMVMQYLDGITLKEFLKRQPGERISFDLAVKALTPIMDALREVHSAGYVHRDISPDNIFITRQKQVKLLDFGAARYAIGEHSKSLTTVLKHGYAPVEQYSTKGNQGPWTDVYAVAATLYRCVTGQVPPDAMERMQGDETIKSPNQMGIEIPLQGELSLMKGLALKASDRFESIMNFQVALGSVSVEPPLTSPNTGVIQPGRSVDAKIVECPECGAKNQLQPGDDPSALRCGSCKRELGVGLQSTSPQKVNIKNSSSNSAMKPVTWAIIIALFALIGSISFFFMYENPKEQFEKGKILVESDKTASAELIIKSANRGYVEAQLLAATLYFNGIGVEKNDVIATNLLMKASNSGDMSAKYRLAICYRFGVGISENPSEAEKLFKVAAENGNTKAAESLGNMYHFGDKIPQNHAEAYKWLLIAANSGSHEAQAKVGWHLLNGNGVAKNSYQSAEWLKKSAEGNSSFGQRLLASMYFTGDGITQDESMGRFWIKKAADNGDETAKEMIREFAIY